MVSFHGAPGDPEALGGGGRRGSRLEFQENTVMFFGLERMGFGSPDRMVTFGEGKFSLKFGLCRTVVKEVEFFLVF